MLGGVVHTFCPSTGETGRQSSVMDLCEFKALQCEFQDSPGCREELYLERKINNLVQKCPNFCKTSSLKSYGLGVYHPVKIILVGSMFFTWKFGSLKFCHICWNWP